MLATANMPTAPAGVLVSLDETGEYAALTVTIPASVALSSLPRAFIRACHQAAGNAGATIEFKRVA